MAGDAPRGGARSRYQRPVTASRTELHAADPARNLAADQFGLGLRRPTVAPNASMPQRPLHRFSQGGVLAARRIPSQPRAADVSNLGPMCDRYVLPDQGAAEREFLPEPAWWKFAARFNVAPQQYVPAVRVHAGQTEGMMIRWGLIPSWAEGQPTGDPTASADIDGLEHSIIYRMPWLSGQRCILPVAGFYTWQLTGANYRQPYFVRLTNRSLFGVAA